MMHSHCILFLSIFMVLVLSFRGSAAFLPFINTCAKRRLKSRLFWGLFCECLLRPRPLGRNPCGCDTVGGTQTKSRCNLHETVPTPSLTASASRLALRFTRGSCQRSGASPTGTG